MLIRLGICLGLLYVGTAAVASQSNIGSQMFEDWNIGFGGRLNNVPDDHDDTQFVLKAVMVFADYSFNLESIRKGVIGCITTLPLLEILSQS